MVLPDLTIGPFTGPAPGFQRSFWFDNGFQGTDVLAHDMYVTAYFPRRSYVELRPTDLERGQCRE